ncbi:MAG: amidophosphoribosyltransferase [Hydrogenibacillus schlegelii]|uniref:Amidophosphoribosyltransferase n=1 Tax=Hydrogenibacillus schlegelii TaxID=1484 RepID=A0A947CZZ1_HYDSH|nr:amidophosphoribosyltransferase [Hydrogenibacillus schlegelii]
MTIFALWGRERAAEAAIDGLLALQHRGQEAAGLVTSDGMELFVRRGRGLVAEALAGAEALPGDRALGHVRDRAAADEEPPEGQPFVETSGRFALVISGGFTEPESGALLSAGVPERSAASFSPAGARRPAAAPAEGVAPAEGAASAFFFRLAAALASGGGSGTAPEAAFAALLRRLRGGFAAAALFPDRLLVARDPHGIRPLSYGRIPGGVAVATETPALYAVGATDVADVPPGMLLIADGAGFRAVPFAEPGPLALCSFELLYFARPDAAMDGRVAHVVRRALGRRLAEEAPAEGEVVIGVPDSSLSAAMGFAEASGLPFDFGLIKNRYVGRTFIRPEAPAREQGVRRKLAVLAPVVRGRSVVVVDDSIVRGTTMRRIVKLLREAGARAVHVRIAAPPVRHPCPYGVNFTSRDELIAARADVEAMRRTIGAESLRFLSPEGFRAAVGGGVCLGCFQGEYPVAWR